LAQRAESSGAGAWVLRGRPLHLRVRHGGIAAASAVPGQMRPSKANAVRVRQYVVCWLVGRGLHAEARTAAAAANPSSISPNVPLKATRATALASRLLERSRILC
jgi:hypothetical protein